MATVSAFSSSPWPNSNPNPNSTSASVFSSLPDESEPVDCNSDSASDRDVNNPSCTTPEPLRSPTSLLHLSFNQDYGCFSAGTDHGFRIYNCDPFREIFRRDFDRGGGIGFVEMLFRCNILALVGGGPDPQYPPNKVMIWDDHQSRCIGELSFRSVVRSVRLRRDRIVLVLEQKVFVYNFADLKLLHQIETFANPKGLCEVSQMVGSMVLACPGLQKGQIRIEHYASKRTNFIMAHDSRIACFALTSDGQLLASASTKGTLVRVFNTIDGTLLQEVRRGADRAEIYSLAFCSNAQWLAVSSDKGTVHVFSLKVVNSGFPGIDNSEVVSDSHLAATTSNSSLSFFKGVLPKYFSSEWSVAQFRLLEGSPYIVAFGQQKNTLIIIGIDGRIEGNRGYPKKRTQLLSTDRREMGTTLTWIVVEDHRYDPPASRLAFELFIEPMIGMGAADEALVEENKAKLCKVLDIYETRLSQSKYLAGDCVTLADLRHLPALYYLMETEAKKLFESRPHVSAWGRLKSLSRPSWSNEKQSLKI